MARINTAEKTVLRLARMAGATPYKCPEHGIYAIAKGNNDPRCPYCKKECARYEK